jgi:hypothetical protein
MKPARGAILLEVMLALGLFVGSAAFCLAVTRSLFAALDRADRRQLAVDLARSRLAELEAGMVTLQELRGEWGGGVGSVPDDVDLEAGDPGSVWEIEITTTPSEYRGLSLIELTVAQVQTGTGAAGDDAVRYTLRQLIALREQDVEDYQLDEMMEGLEGVRQ